MAGAATPNDIISWSLRTRHAAKARTVIYSTSTSTRTVYHTTVSLSGTGVVGAENNTKNNTVLSASCGVPSMDASQAF